MKSKALEKYLIQQGLDENSKPEKLKEAKAQYLKNYHRTYKKIRRQNLKYLRLELSKEDYSTIQKMASRHKMKVATFARESIFSYLNQRYLIPNNGEITRLKFEIRKIGTNINQVVRRFHQDKYPDYYRVVFDLKQKVNDLENMLANKFENPPNMIDLLEDIFRRNPETIQQVKNLISKIEEE